MIDKPPPPAARLGWAFYALLGLATGPGIYALQHGNTFAAVGYAALAGLWYLYGSQSLALFRCRVAVSALVLAIESGGHAALAKSESARLLASDSDGPKGPA